MLRLVVRPLPYRRAYLVRPWAHGCRYGAGRSCPPPGRTAEAMAGAWCGTGSWSLDVVVAVADRRSPSSDGQAQASAEGRLLWRRPGPTQGHGMDGRPRASQHCPSPQLPGCSAAWPTSSTTTTPARATTTPSPGPPRPSRPGPRRGQVVPRPAHPVDRLAAGRPRRPAAGPAGAGAGAGWGRGGALRDLIDLNDPTTPALAVVTLGWLEAAEQVRTAGSTAQDLQVLLSVAGRQS